MVRNFPPSTPKLAWMNIGRLGRSVYAVYPAPAAGRVSCPAHPLSWCSHAPGTPRPSTSQTRTSPSATNARGTPRGWMSHRAPPPKELVDGCANPRYTALVTFPQRNIRGGGLRSFQGVPPDQSCQATHFWGDGVLSCLNISGFLFSPTNSAGRYCPIVLKPLPSFTPRIGVLIMTPNNAHKS